MVKMAYFDLVSMLGVTPTEGIVLGFAQHKPIQLHKFSNTFVNLADFDQWHTPFLKEIFRTEFD